MTRTRPPIIPCAVAARTAFLSSNCGNLEIGMYMSIWYILHCPHWRSFQATTTSPTHTATLASRQYHPTPSQLMPTLAPNPQRPTPQSRHIRPQTPTTVTQATPTGSRTLVAVGVGWHPCRSRLCLQAKRFVIVTAKWTKTPTKTTRV